jgi:phospholipase/carboxylesterase
MAETLNGPIVEPAAGGAPEQVVVFLHGLGADGNDLIGLAPVFQRILPGALFVSPHAPFPCDMAPQGRQWFSIQDMDRLDGVAKAAPFLDAFIDEILETYGLGAGRLALVGFSQGTMMSLHVGLRRAEAIAGILGYSGMVVGPESLAAEIASRPPVMLIHGDADPVVPFSSLALAVEALTANGVDVGSHVCAGVGHGIDDAGLRLGQEFLARVFAANQVFDK